MGIAIQLRSDYTADDLRALAGFVLIPYRRVGICHSERFKTATRKTGQPPGSKLDAHDVFILNLVEEKPDVALHEIAEQLASEFRLSVCKATVWHFFDKRGITFKKDSACERTAARRCEDSPPGLVRGATRPRPSATCLHR